MTPQSTKSCARCMGFVSALILFALSSTPAQATTYQFAFTTSQVMSALEASQGTALYSEAAYFAIFIQPDPAVITSYSWGTLTPPNQGDADQWDTTTINDPSNPNLGYSVAHPCTANCTWAQFSKDPNQTNVEVISGNNGGTGGSNIFLGQTYSNNSPPPYGWGSVDGLIDEIMPLGATFYINITTNQVLSGAYNFKGRASAIESGSPFTVTFDTKEEDGIAFNLTGTAAPEPDTLILFLSGAAFLAFGRILRKRTNRRPQTPGTD